MGEIISDLRHPKPISRNDSAIQRRTVNLIIEVMDKIMRGGDYEDAMVEVFRTLSSAIHADRIYILEKRRRLGSRFVEWCADGVEPRIAGVNSISDGALNNFLSRFSGDAPLFAASLEELGVTNNPIELAYFQRFGVDSVFSLPLYDSGRFVGCLAADSYTIDEGIDFLRLIDTIGPCMAKAISNHQLLEELEWSTTHDSLTGLLNRPGIDAAASELIESNPDGKFVLGLVDIDDFKAVNDLYGHEAGDEALIDLADSLADALPDNCLIGRNGGDELLVVLPGETPEQADKILRAFAETPIEFTAGGRRVGVTSSIGYAAFPDQASSLTELCRLADAALYSSKLSGKAQATRYSDSLDFRLRSQLGFTPRDIADNLPGAVMVFKPEGNGTILYYNKPVVELFECDSMVDFLDYAKGNYRLLVHPDDFERVSEEAASQAKRSGNGGFFSVDFRIITKSGSVKSVAQNGRIIDIDGIGLVVYALVIDCAGHSSLPHGE